MINSDNLSLQTEIVHQFYKLEKLMATRAHKQEVRSNTAVGSLPTEIREGRSHLHPRLPALAQRFEFNNDRIIQEIIVEKSFGGMLLKPLLSRN